MNRKHEVINILLDRTNPITLHEIAAQLNVSERTIRNDLKDIEVVILKHELILLKKPRVGIQILGNEKNKNQLLMDLFQKKDDVTGGYSKQNREKFILSKLLEGKNRLYVEYFAKELYASKSSIEKDLFHVNNWLVKHKLKLVRKDNQGLYIEGSELDIRNAYAMIISDMKEEGVSINDTLKHSLGIDILDIERILIGCEREFHEHLGEANIKNLAFHIGLSIKRIRDNKAIKEMKEDDSFPIIHYQDNEFVIYLIRKLETLSNIKFPTGEIQYIMMHLVGITIDHDFLNIGKQILPHLRLLANDIANAFIYNVESIVCLGLPNNVSFKESLMTHLLPTIYRLKYNLNLYNPLLQEIKENYAAIFALAKMVNPIFKKILGVEANDDEIAFIALHLSIAIEDTKAKHHIAIVCPMGRGISRFLLLKLEENFPNVNFLNFSKKDIEEETSPYIDMVISTLELDIEIPYVVICPILSKEDIKKIQLLLSQSRLRDKKYFSLQSILLEKEKKKKEEILYDLANRLQVCGYVDHTFYDGLLKRETMGSTEIGDGIILTHGFHESVFRSQIAFYRLSKPILWNSEHIYFVVAMAIASQDAKNVSHLDWLYKTLNNKKVMQQIRDSKTELEIYNYLVNEHMKY